MRLGKSFGGDALDRFLAGRINIEQADVSASAKAVANSSIRSRVRVKRCGWKMTCTRANPHWRAAARVARISVGWWP